MIRLVLPALVGLTASMDCAELVMQRVVRRCPGCGGGREKVPRVGHDIAHRGDQVAPALLRPGRGEPELVLRLLRGSGDQPYSKDKSQFLKLLLSFISAIISSAVCSLEKAPKELKKLFSLSNFSVSIVSSFKDSAILFMSSTFSNLLKVFKRLV